MLGQKNVLQDSPIVALQSLTLTRDTISFLVIRPLSWNISNQLSIPMTMRITDPKEGKVPQNLEQNVKCVNNQKNRSIVL